VARIPPEFLQAGAHDLRRELRFGAEEFLADIPRGRVTVALSNIAAQYPEAFRAPITDADDREVRLPLQKVLEQLVGDRATGVPPAPPRASDPRPLPAPVEETPAAPPQPAVPESTEPTIRLSLAAILAGCPDGVFAGERPSVAESIQVALPFEPIEQQLPTGIVEIDATQLLALLPPPYSTGRFLRGDARIPLPIEEIFRNLPRGVVLSRPPAPESPAVSAEGRRFFAPGPLHLHSVPPPPLLVQPIGENGAHASHASREADAPPAASGPAAAPEPVFHLARPPLGRPLVVLPPPALAAADESPVETTSDQTAVLEFLAGADEAKPAP
jgi:hypothetical protein